MISRLALHIGNSPGKATPNPVRSVTGQSDSSRPWPVGDLQPRRQLYRRRRPRAVDRHTAIGVPYPHSGRDLGPLIKLGPVRGPSLEVSIDGGSLRGRHVTRGGGGERWRGRAEVCMTSRRGPPPPGVSVQSVTPTRPAVINEIHHPPATDQRR